MHEEQLAALRECLERTPPRREPPKSQDQIDWESLQEHWAEERKHDRENRPLSRSEWARREEAS